MKNTMLYVFITCLLLTGISCKKDDEKLPDAPNPPHIVLANDIIITSLGEEFFMEADLADSVGLKSFTLRYDDWYLYNTVDLKDSTYPKKYHVRYKFRMPDTAANKIHSIVLTATNVGNNASSAQFKILLNADFPKMYLVDDPDPAKLTTDLFGVPMRINKVGSYSYEATYYAATPNAKVWFIPGKTALKPIMYGIDPANNTKLSGDYAHAQPFVLPTPGYYKISFHTLNLTYEVQPLPTPNPAGAFAQVALAGQGFYDYPNILWQNAMPDLILLDKDPTNPYRFTKTVKLGIPPGQTYTDASFIFTTNNGWTDFWRFDSGGDPETNVFNGGTTGGNFPISGTPVTYKVTFDTYLNRSKFEKQ